jgi:hypothetical protein
MTHSTDTQIVVRVASDLGFADLFSYIIPTNDDPRGRAIALARSDFRSRYGAGHRETITIVDEDEA